MDGNSPDMRLITGPDGSPPPSTSGLAQDPVPARAPLLGRVSALRTEMELLIERMDEIEERFLELDALNAYTEESAAFRLDQSRYYGPRNY